MNEITKKFLTLLSDMETTPEGAYNIRQDGQCAGRKSSENVDIVPKSDNSGIDIIVKANTKGETIYIPACITRSNVSDLVYNDFFIGDNADITIVAGCGVHTDGEENSQHNGIHRFFVSANAHVSYVEKHIGTGEGTGKRIINPKTHIELGENSYMEMDTVQIEGVDSTKRDSTAKLAKDAKLVIKEKIMTHDNQYAETNFDVDLDGENSGANLISRSVAKGTSRQLFRSRINGNNVCTGHSECDAIIMDKGVVSAIPELTANDMNAALIHEAAIGKIAGDQLIKLMTMGLTEAEAEAKIIDGFLK